MENCEKQFEETKAGVKGLVDSGITKIPRIFIHTRQRKTVLIMISRFRLSISRAMIEVTGERRLSMALEMQQRHGVSFRWSTMEIQLWRWRSSWKVFDDFTSSHRKPGRSGTLGIFGVSFFISAIESVDSSRLEREFVLYIPRRWEQLRSTASTLQVTRQENLLQFLFFPPLPVCFCRTCFTSSLSSYLKLHFYFKFYWAWMSGQFVVPLEV